MIQIYNIKKIQYFLTDLELFEWEAREGGTLLHGFLLGIERMDGLDREHAMRTSNIKDYRNGDGRTASGRQAATSSPLHLLTLHLKAGLLNNVIV